MKCIVYQKNLISQYTKDLEGEEKKKIFKIPLTKLKTKLIVDKFFINKSHVYILKYAKPKKKKKKSLCLSLLILEEIKFQFFSHYSP